MKATIKFTLGIVAIGFGVAGQPHVAAAAPFGLGNLIVQSNDSISEYALDGTLLQTFAIPTAGDHGARDITIDQAGRLHVYDGTFDPVLSSYDSTTGWTHQTATGWSTVNNVSYGGIGSIGDLVFVSDMSTFGDDGADQASGVVRFNTATGESTRFADGTQVIDLNIGLDGLLYTLSPGGSPEGRFVDIYDPMSMSLLSSLSLASIFGHTGHRSIAADALGNLFIADWDGDLSKIAADGTILLETNICFIALSCNLYDIDVSAAGQIAVSDRSGGITLTDTDFSSFNSLGFSGDFVAFTAPVPIPAALWLFVSALAALQLPKRMSPSF